MMNTQWPLDALMFWLAIAERGVDIFGVMVLGVIINSVPATPTLRW